MSIKPLTVGEVEFIAYELARKWFDQTEPIPAFETRYPAKLESCLEQPFIAFRDFEPYPEIEDKAAILFYLIIKNHPFLNGNKRLAVTITLNFLSKNGKWIDATSLSLYEVARTVAASKANEKDVTVADLRRFFRDHLTDF